MLDAPMIDDFHMGLGCLEFSVYGTLTFTVISSDLILTLYAHKKLISKVTWSILFDKYRVTQYERNLVSCLLYCH